eukprot:1151505-Pleurochrysis_carterae.AAC.1
MRRRFPCDTQAATSERGRDGVRSHPQGFEVRNRLFVRRRVPARRRAAHVSVAKARRAWQSGRTAGTGGARGRGGTRGGWRRQLRGRGEFDMYAACKRTTEHRNERVSDGPDPGPSARIRTRAPMRSRRGVTCKRTRS